MGLKYFDEFESELFIKEIIKAENKLIENKLLSVLVGILFYNVLTNAKWN
jgi:hypothetical protein